MNYVTPIIPWGRDMGKALTVKTLETIKPGPIRREVPDGYVRGLYFVVQPSGMMSWACRYRLGNRTRKYTIGSYPAVGLVGARKLARDALEKVAGGVDPYDVKKAARQPPDRDLVERVVSTFVERHAKPNTRPATAAETERSLTKEVVGRWKGRRLSTITKADVHEMLDEIVDRGSPISANRLLATFRKCCGWAVERGLIDVSPCDGVKPPAVGKSRDRVLSDDELRRIWHACERLSYPFGPLVRLLIITAQRRDEVAGMTVAEVDQAARLWVLPRERAKNDVEHPIPLPSPALAIIAGLPRFSTGDEAEDAKLPDFLFTTTRTSHVTGFSKAKLALDKLIAADGGDPLAPWTFHDLRRTAATGLARLGVNLPVIERILNHISGPSFGGVAGVYQKYGFADEMRRGLDKWAAHVERLTNEVGGNVVGMVRAS
ncbi:tyrosine-type recombinase/integrase [Lichenibacterium minor]|nr:site-specific integrase [Lichenibacterium minor]